MDISQKKAALFGAFCADAYALGAHWVYDCDVIENAIRDWKVHNAPVTEYHKGKSAGDFTHYGDQMLWLLESIARENDFDMDAFARLWQQKMQNYQGYIDGASKATLAVLNDSAEHTGSRDLSAAGRFAPLIYLYGDDLNTLLQVVEEHAAFTHDNSMVEESSLYFAEVSYHLLQGQELEKTLREVVLEYNESIQTWVKEGFESRSQPTRDAIRDFGQSCGVSSGLPGVIHLLLRYQDDYEKAMVENVKAGGDSAARGMIAGTILGIIQGMEAIPAHWIASLTDIAKIKQYMSEIDAHNP